MFTVSCNFKTSNHIRYPISNQLFNSTLGTWHLERCLSRRLAQCDAFCQNVNADGAGHEGLYGLYVSMPMCAYAFSSGPWYNWTSRMSAVSTMCTARIILYRNKLYTVHAFLLPFHDVPAYLGNKFAHPQRSMQSSCHFYTCTHSRWRRLKSFQLHDA